MELADRPISETSCRRLREQGFIDYANDELARLRLGIRFAYALCTLLVVIGAVFQSPVVLGLALLIAAGGTVLPKHPFDYLYNRTVRHLLNRPPVPARPPQARFACGVATVWLGTVIYALVAGFLTTFYVLAAALVVVGTLVSAFDKCIPSVVYNALFAPEGEMETTVGSE